jgi:hypothetical protein
MQVQLRSWPSDVSQWGTLVLFPAGSGKIYPEFGPQ